MFPQDVIQDFGTNRASLIHESTSGFTESFPGKFLKCVFVDVFGDHFVCHNNTQRVCLFVHQSAEQQVLLPCWLAKSELPGKPSASITQSLFGGESHKLISNHSTLGQILQIFLFDDSETCCEDSVGAVEFRHQQAKQCAEKGSTNPPLQPAPRS